MSATAPCVWATARVANLAWSHCTHPTTVDTIVSGDIQTNGCFECESVAAILTTMRQQRPSLLVDIGGNIGMYTAAAATQFYIENNIEKLNEWHDHIYSTDSG